MKTTVFFDTIHKSKVYIELYLYKLIYLLAKKKFDFGQELWNLIGEKCKAVFKTKFQESAN